MSIHSEHPFLPPPQDRDAVRRVRGRLTAPVTVWATGADRDRTGLTVSSLLVADGEPAELLALVDPDSDFGEAVLRTRTAMVSVLAAGQQPVADVFAGRSPSPGGLFRTGEWTETGWGPALAGSAGRVGVRLRPGTPERVGWGLLLRGVIEEVALADDDPDLLAYLRGRYRALPSAP